MDTHRVNPRRYDTEFFDFHFELKSGTLNVKIKNESIDGSRIEEPYRLHIGKNGVVAVDIHNLFGDDPLPCPTHVHKLSQFFLPWFKLNQDSRVELERGIRRFYALQAYELLDKNSEQFEAAIKLSQTSLDAILEKLPDLFKRRNAIAERLISNHQNKGVSTTRGTTVFDTKDIVYVLYETPELSPKRPEYLWAVSHFSPAFAPELGYADFVDYVNGEAASNNLCLEYIMQAQKKLYGISPMDLDKEEQNITNIEGVVTQLELILNIYGGKSNLGRFENEGRLLSDG